MPRPKKKVSDILAQKLFQKAMSQRLSDKGISNDEFAKKLNISLPEAIRFIHCGIPESSKFLIQACDYLDLDPLDFYEISPLALLRLKTGLSRTDIAKRLRSTVNSIRNFETSGRAKLTPTQLVELSKIYDCTVSELLKRAVTLRGEASNDR